VSHETSNHPEKPARRRILRALGWGGLAGVSTGGFALARTPMNSYYDGPASDHFDGRKFFNPTGPGPKSFGELARWQFGTRAEAWPETYPSPFPAASPEARLATGQTRLTAIGHASCLLQTAGLNILFDPVYVKRASPVQFAGPKRANPPGIPFEALPKIDVLLLSHNHYDHMDLDAIGRIWSRDKPAILTPLGNDKIMRADVPTLEARALDWGQAHTQSGATIHCVPTQHWSARGTRDRMHALWSSFVITGPRHTVYLIGDTGFGDGGTFQQVASRFPSIDLAWMPIGAYEPQWFMRDQHMNPSEAVQAFGIVKPRRALGHHWGTFKLTNEAVDTPKRDLEAAAGKANLRPDQFTAARPAEVVEIGG
jgi:L-ascorbate metabolism protein UlaG (beta-lactamase superfamily)